MSKKDDELQKKQDTFLNQEELPNVSLIDHATTTVSRGKIALDTLARYSGTDPNDFQKYLLLTNFPSYVDQFAAMQSTELSIGSVLRVSHDKKNKISIIDYRVGAPMAALVVDVLSYIKPEVVLMLGLCGGLHRNQEVGNFILPIAAIRDEGASQHYMPTRVPSLPAFLVQQYISQVLLGANEHFFTGVLHTTDYRMWEFDEGFRERLIAEKASAIDMECSALFTVGFAQKVPVGALMLISDLPLDKKGIKTKDSANHVFKRFSDKHLRFGIESLRAMQSVSKEINFRRYQF